MLQQGDEASMSRVTERRAMTLPTPGGHRFFTALSRGAPAAAAGLAQPDFDAAVLLAPRLGVVGCDGQLTTHGFELDGGYTAFAQLAGDLLASASTRARSHVLLHHPIG
jgi:hypothetical protein